MSAVGHGKDAREAKESLYPSAANDRTGVRSIGAKSIAVVGFFAVALITAASAGFLDSEYLLSLTPATCLWIGLFAALATELISQLWRPDDRSRSHLGVIRGEPAQSDPLGTGTTAFLRVGTAHVVLTVENEGDAGGRRLPSCHRAPSTRCLR